MRSPRPIRDGRTPLALLVTALACTAAPTPPPAGHAAASDAAAPPSYGSAPDAVPAAADGPALAPDGSASDAPPDLEPSAPTLPSRICGQLGAAIVAVAFSPDGKRLAALGREAIQVVTVPGATPVLTAPIAGVAGDGTEIVFSPDGTLVAAGGARARVWRVDDRSMLTDLVPPNQDYVASVAFSPDGRQLALGTHYAGVVVYDWPTLMKLHAWIPEHTTSLAAIVYTADSSQLVVRGFSSLSRVRVDTGQTLWQVAAPGSHPDLAVSPDGRFVATIGGDGPARLHRAEDGVVVREFARKDGRISFSPDGQFLLAGDRRAPAVVWRVDDGSVAATFPTNGPRLLALSPDGTVLVTVTDDGGAALWCR